MRYFFVKYSNLNVLNVVVFDIRIRVRTRTLSKTAVRFSFTKCLMFCEEFYRFYCIVFSSQILLNCYARAFWRMYCRFSCFGLGTQKHWVTLNRNLFSKLWNNVLQIWKVFYLTYLNMFLFGYNFKHWLWKVVFLVQIFGTIHCVKRRLPFQIKQTKSGGQRELASTQQFLLPASFEFYPHCCGSFTGIEGDIISMWMASLILYFG